MERSSQSISNLYLNKPKTNKQSRSQVDTKQKKVRFKIQYYNQNLEDAIKEVKTHIQENPQWKLTVKQITQKYQTYAQQPPQSQQSILNTNQHLKVHQSEQPSREVEKSANPNQMQTKIDYQQLKFTIRQKKISEDRKIQLKQQRMKLEASSLEKQIQFRLERKISQNQKLKEKMALLKDIQEKRQASQRNKEKHLNYQKEEREMIHDQNLAKIQMLRRYKKKTQKKMMRESQSQQSQSLNEMQFNIQVSRKTKQEQQEILLNRYQSLRCTSQRNLRKRGTTMDLQAKDQGISRKHILTSQSSRKAN